MTADFKSMQKMEGLPAFSQARLRPGQDRISVVIKLRRGASRPAYVEARADFGSEMFSAEIAINDLQRLNEDPAVESVAPARSLSRID
jgi:hypothetical protein